MGDESEHLPPANADADHAPDRPAGVRRGRLAAQPGSQAGGVGRVGEGPQGAGGQGARGPGPRLPGQGARHDERPGRRRPAARRGRTRQGQGLFGGRFEGPGPRRRRACAGGPGHEGQAGVVHRPQGHRPARLLRLPRRAGLRDGQADRHGPERLGQEGPGTSGFRGRRRLRPRTLQHRQGTQRPRRPAPGGPRLALEGRQAALRGAVLRRTGAPFARRLFAPEAGGPAQLRLQPSPRLGRPAAHAAVPLRPVAPPCRRDGRGLSGSPGTGGGRGPRGRDDVHPRPRGGADSVEVREYAGPGSLGGSQGP